MVKIQGDGQAGGQLSPSEVVVPSGTIVRWVNTDASTRSVEAADGSFASPVIAPGASWEHRFEKPGRIEYHDGTRPYAVATLTVT